jgi:Ca2+/Na+ antiporter
MLAFAKLLVVGFLFLSVVYICLSLYSRAVRREKLEREWDEEIQQGDRDAFVTAGLRDYDGSLRRKLILGVYIVPMVVICAIIYFTNFY